MEEAQANCELAQAGGACNCGDLDKCCLYFITQVGRGGIKDLPQSSSYPDFKQSVHTGLA
jgi:hypothetical protein